MRAPAALAVLVLASLACSGDATGPSAVPLSLTPQVDTVRPSAVVVLDVLGARVTADTVTGRLGGAPVTLYRLDERALALLAPDLAAGAYPLAVALDGDTVRTTLTMLAPLAIADPAAAITELLTARAGAFPTEAPRGFDPAEWASQRAELDSLVADVEAQVAALDGAQRLALARLLASMQPAPAPAVVSSMQATAVEGQPVAELPSLFWKMDECTRAKSALAKAMIAATFSLGSLYIFLNAPIPFVYGLGGAAVSAAASAASLLATKVAFLELALVCGVQRTVDVEDDLFAATLRLPTAGTDVVGPRRFFTNRAVTYAPVGEFRPVSNVEVPRDVALQRIADLGDAIASGYGRVLAQLPDAIARKLPAPPPRLSQTAPGATTLRRVPYTGVRIENVRPSSVALTASGSDSTLRLTAGRTVTDDVPFTFDVVSAYDPTLKVTKSAVLRPMMSATVPNAPPASVTGTRTTAADANGNLVGTLTCGGSITVRVKGGDRARWENFSWTISGPGTLSETTLIRAAGGGPAYFESGDHPFGGSWYWSWTENGQPVFKPFSVTVNITYTDLLTNTLKSVPAITFACG